MFRLNGGIDYCFDVLVAFIADHGSEALRQELAQLIGDPENVRTAAAADLLLGELIQKIFPLLGGLAEPLQHAGRELRSADGSVSEAAAALEAARAAWQAAATQFRDSLRTHGKWAQDRDLAQGSLIPNAIAPWVRAYLELNGVCSSIEAPECYGHNRGFVLRMVEKVRVAAAAALLDDSPRVVGLAAFETQFEALNRAQAEFEAAQELARAARQRLSAAWESYSARRATLAKELGRLSEGAQWALFRLVQAEEADRVDALLMG